MNVDRRKFFASVCGVRTAEQKQTTARRCEAA